MTKQGQAAARNWARANRLAELSQVTAPVCRNYLTTIPEEDKELLDSGADARNKTIRTMIEGAQNHNAPPRAAKGDPDRSARAGAPKSPGIKCEKCGTNIDLLLDIKKLADKHGGLETLIKGVNALQRLRD